jgi:hypothetical protein
MFSMKSTASLPLTILLAVVPAKAETGKAIVKALDGSVSCIEGSEWKALKSGQKLSAGTSVRTSVDGKADLDLGDNGPSLYLFDSTNVRLDQLDITKKGAKVTSETRLTLTAGTIRGLVRKLTPGGKYEVHAPYVSMVLMGTPSRYQVSASGRVSLLDGSASVDYTNPVTKEITNYIVGSGQTFAFRFSISYSGGLAK